MTEADIQPFSTPESPAPLEIRHPAAQSDTVKIPPAFRRRPAGRSPPARRSSLPIENEDHWRSKDYGEIRDAYRPGHADYNRIRRNGVRDYRGGGRQSARTGRPVSPPGRSPTRPSPICFGPGLTIQAALVQVGADRIRPAAWDWAETANNPFWCPDAARGAGKSYLDAVRRAGSSVGAVIEVVAEGVPAGLGAALRQARRRPRLCLRGHQRRQ